MLTPNIVLNVPHCINTQVRIYPPIIILKIYVRYWYILKVKAELFGRALIIIVDKIINNNLCMYNYLMPHVHVQVIKSTKLA